MCVGSPHGGMCGIFEALKVAAAAIFRTFKDDGRPPRVAWQV